MKIKKNKLFYNVDFSNLVLYEKIIYSTAGHQLVQEIGKETDIDAFDYLVKLN